MPLPILASLGAGAGNAARALTGSIAKGIGNIKSGASSALSGVGKFFQKGSSAESVKHAISGQNTAKTESIDAKRHGTIVKEHGETQEEVRGVRGALKETSAESHEIIGREGNETQSAINSLEKTTKDIAKSEADRLRKHREEDRIRDAQAARIRNRQHDESLNAIRNTRGGVSVAQGGGMGGGLLEGLANLLSSGLSGIVGGIAGGLARAGVKGVVKLGKQVTRGVVGLGKLVTRGVVGLGKQVYRAGSGLLRLAGGVRALAIGGKALAIGAAGYGLGYSMVKLYDYFAGTDYADEGSYGLKSLVTEGTITPEVKRAKEFEKQQKEMDEADKMSAKSSLSENTKVKKQNIQNKKRNYEIGSAIRHEEVNLSTGAFKDIGKRQQALEEGKSILETFKNLVQQNKDQVKTPGGLDGTAELLIEFVRDTYPTYMMVMERAGFDHKKQSPEGLENFAALYHKIYDMDFKGKSFTTSPDGKSYKPSAQMRTMVQTAALQNESNWSSYGMAKLDEREGVSSTDTMKVTSPSSIDIVAPRQIDPEIQSDKSMEPISSNINIIAPGGGNGGPPPSPSAPPPEMSPDRVTTNTIPESEILAVAYARQTQYATFPAV